MKFEFFSAFRGHQPRQPSPAYVTGTCYPSVLRQLYCTVTLSVMNRVYVVEGCYPDHLIKLWDLYAKKGQSENDRPGTIF